MFFPTKQKQREDHEASWEKKISIVEIFKHGVCRNYLQVLRPTIRMNEHVS